ncbi:putative WRKY transcription factor 14 [Platanthera guangdongensis]|uniref:WRKY transcription factor 14 n=1 Tax=Platanthera guangdongensis TaxID=2320717 RepID=A0ABR2LV54_9ASPA
MCKRMENSQGDLADIFRNSSLAAPPENPNGGWHLLPEPPSSFLSTDDNFGDPFSDIRHPLLDEFPAPDFLTAHNKLPEAQGKCSLFSRMLQISPTKPKPAPLGAASVDHGGGLSNSSPRMQGMKRRKSQVKKVVCIPAPPAANGRPTGESVPSDLWAWRKYGQKPIKGSPYPRGYYRCSSSKGCSARKQVERSRTDPNMLVITYTAEHNHPWPTQRNVLAGSTRTSHPPKGNNASVSKSSPHNKSNQVHHEWSSSSAIQAMKEEEELQEMEKSFDESYVMPDNSSHPDNFFADLTELETDPMQLMFPKGFMGDHELDERREIDKAMESFYMFDWGGGSSLEETKRGIVYDHTLEQP